MVAKMPTIAAFSFRHSMGLPYVYPNNDLSFVGNFLAMIKKIGTDTYKVNPGPRARAGGALHPPRRPRAELQHHSGAPGGQQPGGPVLGRGRGGQRLYGPLHGGANEAVLRMLKSIGHVSKVPTSSRR
jgi:citrate synthase